MTIRVPEGFRLAGLHCGLKRNATREDLSLVVSDMPAVAAGVYTEQSGVFAAPVALDRSRTPGSGFRAVAINSGNANACTGERGLADAREMARLAAAACGADGRASARDVDRHHRRILADRKDPRRNGGDRRASWGAMKRRSSPQPAA